MTGCLSLQNLPGTITKQTFLNNENLDSKRATGIQPFMGFKIKLNQRNMWNNLYGSNSAVEEYYDRFSGSWPKPLKKLKMTQSKNLLI
ncbi:MAG: hypothetical protein CM1200mP3_09910 [Chloroflexota bacterium]|nr:MAG: hypothetical protein CM1200mP3_09910 [Chloroflexota bacterium]